MEPETALKKESVDVLLIEDDEDDFFIARSLLSRAKTLQCELQWARSYDEGLAALSAREYDACLVDYRLGARTGLELLAEAHEKGCQTPLILLTGQGDLEVDLRAMSAGAADYLVKWEVDTAGLERSIRYARERKHAEERIREQAALLDKARDAISATDLDGCIIYWNKGAERLTGWTHEEMLGERAEGCLYEPDDPVLNKAHRTVRNEGEWSGELRFKTKDDEDLVVESRWTLVRDGAGEPRSILIINTDVTERKRLESQFLRSQRMESIGGLVGGIAHDLGNLLVPILLGVKVLQQRFGEDEQATRTLGMIQKSAQRGSDMVKQVLAFARGVEGERVPLRIAEIIQEVERLTRETFPSSITFKVDVPDGLPSVTGDATQLQQVLMNLCVNARDAMPNGGTLAIRVEHMTLDDDFSRIVLDAEPGAYVRLEVTDTGEGIPPRVLEKIFEPFFTTKPTGKGTGLGLSTVYSIIKSHGGFVNVDSEAGRGTTFHVYLPASQRGAEVRFDDETGEIERANGELVLVVDDEDVIRETTQVTLENAGYRVLTAGNGVEALAVFTDHADEIALVVTDLMMPEMDGIATIRALRERRPGLPIVAFSGLADGKARQALDAGARSFLSKPFTAEKLCGTLQGLLRQQPA